MWRRDARPTIFGSFPSSCMGTPFLSPSSAWAPYRLVRRWTGLIIAIVLWRARRPALPSLHDSRVGLKPVNDCLDFSKTSFSLTEARASRLPSICFPVPGQFAII
jgi:hypothetical protein